VIVGLMFPPEWFSLYDPDCTVFCDPWHTPA
jgi:hypothetical protein